MKIWLIIVFTVFIKWSASYDMIFIVDVINSYERPTAVNAIVCWDINQMRELTYRLKNSIIPKTIRFTSNSKLNDISPTDMFIFDTGCPNSVDILKQAAQKRIFSNFNRWLVVELLHNAKDVVLHPEWDQLYVTTDSEFIITDIKSNNTVNFLLAYKKLPNAKWSFENFGYWTKEVGFRRADEISISTQMRRRNMEKREIKTTYVITTNRTRYMLDELRDPKDIITKYCFRVLRPLFDFMNATSVKVFTDTWGYMVNGSWNGMLGHIASGEADILGTVIFMTSNRLPVIDYLMYALSSTSKIVFKDPPLSYQNNLFLLPFKTSVWLCIAAFILILLVVLYINANWEAKTAATGTMQKCSISDVAMMILGALSQQGTSQELKGTIGRLVMFILFLTFLFLHTSYSASVVALLQSSSSQIRTLTDLLNSKLDVGVEDTPYNVYFFTKATEPVRKEIYETKVAARGSQKARFMTVEEGVKKLQKEPFAFHMFLGVGYKEVQRIFHEHEKCGLQEISYIPQENPWFASTRDWPYKELIKIGFIRIREHGLFDREQRLLFTKKPACEFRGGSFTSVSIIDVYPAILMLLYGFLISFALLLTEILIHRIQVNRSISYNL